MSNEALFENPREFLLLSGAAKSTVMCFDAEHFTVPAWDEVVKPQEGAKHKPHSGKNSEGEWIPGSLLLRDIYGARGCPDDPTSDGRNSPGSIRGEFWDAKRAIIHCLGIDPQTKKAMSSYAAKGILVLPVNPAPDLVRAERDKARTLYQAFKIKVADQLVRDEADKANTQKKNGREPGLPDNDYYEALETLSEAKKLHKQKVAHMGMDDPFMDAVEGKQETSDEDLIAITRLAAEKAAGHVAGEQAGIDRDELVEILMQDPKFKAAIKNKYKMRKLTKTEVKDAQSYEGA